MPVAVVTGASRGIGAAIAREFARSGGARLALLARDRVRLASVADACRSDGADVLIVPCDVTDDGQVAAAARLVVQEFGPPDILVNNAGSFAPGGVVDTTPRVFREQVEVNLTSAFVVTHAFLPAMMEARRGTIIFLGSVASIKGYPRGVSYGAAKHGLLGLARSLREEVRSAGIRVTTLLPGATYTDSWAASGLPEARFMPPEDVAHLALQTALLDPRTVVEEILLRPHEGDI